MTGISQEVKVVQNERKQMATGPPTRHQKMETEMLGRIQEQIWSRFAADIGSVHSTNSVQMCVKQNAKLPWRRQYYMKPEVEAGIAATN